MTDAGTGPQGAPLRDTIKTPRLDLVLWTAAAPYADPHAVLANAADVLELRAAQLREDPTLAPWLVRAIILRAERVIVGTIGFHDGPSAHDTSATVEIGYEIADAYRRRGYALEAATALIEWAASRAIRRVRASVSPDNAASLALLARLGFTPIGEQVDPIDGRELLLERSLPTS